MNAKAGAERLLYLPLSPLNQSYNQVENTEMIKLEWWRPFDNKNKILIVKDIEKLKVTHLKPATFK